MDQKLSLSEYTAREIRAHLGRERISVSELARRLGWSQSYLARRVDGRVAFDLNDLERITDELGIRILDLLPVGDVANTLRNRGSAESARSRSVSADRPPREPGRQRTRPAGMAPKPSTRRPVMLSRPLPAF